MDVQAILTAISTIGFPIVCTLLLFQQYTKLNDLHKEEYKELKTAIDNNTIALTELRENLRRDDDNA